MYAIYKEVYLDKIYKTYENILIISAIPPNLNNMIRNIRLEKVSVHKPSFNCGYAFKSFLNSNKYMTIEELPNLLKATLIASKDPWTSVFIITGNSEISPA